MDKPNKEIVAVTFAVDSLALGAHWIYDTDKIRKTFGRLTTLQNPTTDSFHPNRKKGDFTPYGDQQWILLESLIKEGGFKLKNYCLDWQVAMNNYDGYKDSATKTTLDNLHKGLSPEDCGSPSTDLSAATRIAPLVWYYQDDLEALLSAVRGYVAMTHHSPVVLDAAQIFARTAFDMLAGENLLPALLTVCHHYRNSDASKLILSGLETKDMDTHKAIAFFGQSCDAELGLPGVGHLIARYNNHPKDAFIENNMAGGESAARGMALGLLFSARDGMSCIDQNWYLDLSQRYTLEKLLHFQPYEEA